MSWKLRYSETAEKQISKLDKGVRRTVQDYLAECCKLDDPADRGHSLTGPFAGMHRYRVGQLRVVVEIDRGVVTILVVTIGRRDTVYK